MSPENLTWRVFGRVAGDQLPSNPVRIGRATLGPLPPDQALEGVERPNIPQPTPSGDTYYVSRGVDLEVRSNCYFWVDVMAPSAESAMERVQLNDIPLLHAALSLRGGELP